MTREPTHGRSLRSETTRAIVTLLLLLPLTLAACGTDDPVAPVVDVATVTLSPTGTTLEALGATVQLTAIASDADGNAVTGAAVTWQSSAPGVGTVSATGLVTAVANGTTAVTATTGGVAATVDVTVSQVGIEVALVTPLTAFTALTQQVSLAAEMRDANGNPLPGAGPVDWGTSDDAVVTVSGEGTAESVANGSATISGTIDGMTGTLDMSVAQVVATVTVAPQADTLRSAGATGQLTAEILDSEGIPVVGATGTWTSSDAAVATVSASGLVTAVGEGVTGITVTEGGQSDSATVTVSFDIVPGSMTIALDNASVFARGGFVATATVLNEDDVELTGLVLTWTASDPSVAAQSVELDGDGRSTALFHTGASLGTFTVRAVTDEGVVGTAKVTVTEPPAGRGVTIGFETLPSGADTCGSPTAEACTISRDYATWGIRFAWTQSPYTTLPTIGFFGPDDKALVNGRRSLYEHVTGNLQMDVSVPIAGLAMTIRYPTAALEAGVTVYDESMNVVEGAVVERVTTIVGAARDDEIVVHAPVVIGRIVLGYLNGITRVGEIVY